MPLFPPFPASLVPASIWSRPTESSTGKEVFSFFFLIQISFLLFSPQQKLAVGWVRGVEEEQGVGETMAGSWPAAAVSAASPQGYSREAAWGTAPPQPSLCSLNPGGKPAAMPFRQPGRIFLGHLRWPLRGCL